MKQIVNENHKIVREVVSKEKKTSSRMTLIN